MITVTLEDRRGEPLGKLAKNGEGYLAKNGQAQNRIAPTPFGEAVLEALAEMPRIAPQVEIIAEQLMPDHIHFIGFVKAQLARPLGSLVRGFKAGAAKRWKGYIAKNGESQGYIAKNGESQNCPSSVTGHSCAGGSVPAHSCAGLRWAEGFQDTVLLHEGQLKAMIAYLRDNPRRLADKRANPALFRRVERIALPLDGGRITGSFEALGSEAKRGGGMKIVRTPDGEPIIESESPEYRERLESALAAAEHGAVVLSPCISDGERQIAREAMKRRLPLVALKNMGFAKLEKPAGRYFDACAEGRLLLLAPAAWPYTTQEKPMTRFDATALNRIAQWLAGGTAGLNQHLFKVYSDKYDKWFVYSWTNHYLASFIKIAADKATTMGHITRDHLDDAKVCIPFDSDIEQVGRVMKPLYDEIITKRIESRSLAAMRDALLPKLMSGEIDVEKVKVA